MGLTHGGARVGPVVHQLGDRRWPPQGLAGGGHDAVFVQVPGDLAERDPLQVLGEDAAHDVGLGLVDLEVGRAGLAASDSAIPVGDLPEDGLTGAHPIQLATPVPLRHLGLLVLADHTLYLDEQPGLGVVVDRGRVGEDHRHPEAGQLVEDEHLVSE
jgi:hypothetical protein